MVKDPYDTEQERALLRRHRLWYLLAIGLGVIGLASNHLVIFAAGLLFAVITIIPEIWYRSGQRDLIVEEALSATQAFVGDLVTLDIRVANQKRLPLPWIEVCSDIPSPLEMRDEEVVPSFYPMRSKLVNHFALWSWRTAHKRHTIYCAKRGYYWLGPIQIATSDPLGWLIHDRTVTPPPTVLQVYPLVAPLAEFRLPANYPFGDQATARRLLEDPLRLAGVRPYVPGDDPRLIHWKASARTGDLLRKVLDPAGQHRLMVVLDVNTTVAQGWWIDPIIMELSISLAGSLALWGIDNGYATGLLANSPIITEFSAATTTGDHLDTPGPRMETLFLAPTSHRSQRERILSGLARILPLTGANIEDVIALHRRAFIMGTTVLLVSSTYALRAASVEFLLGLRQQGLGVHLVLTGDGPHETPIPVHDLPTHYIGGKEVWNELITAARHRATTTGGNVPFFTLG